jgi:hypothetical protein
MLGKSEITAPNGWVEFKKTEDKLVLRSPDQHQQATITVVELSADPTLENFTRLCQRRIDAEKSELSDGFIEPENPKPIKNGDTFGLLYSGGDKKTGRVFSAYLSSKRREFLTLYVEGVAIAPKDHLESFKAFVSGLKRK